MGMNASDFKKMSQTHPLSLLVCLLILFTSTLASRKDVQYCRSTISQQVQQVIGNFPATFGMYFTYGNTYRNSILNSSELFNWDGRRFYQPASNNKVLTTIAALTHFGTKFQFQTKFYYDYKQGQLVIRPLGDPTLTFDRLQYGLKSAMRQLNSVEKIVIDGSFFNSNPFTNQGVEDFPDSWEWGNMQYSFSSLPSIFSLEHNTIEFTVTPSTLINQPFKVELDERFNFASNVITFDTSFTKSIDCSSNSPTTLSSFYVPLRRSIVVRGQLCIGSQPQRQELTIMDPADFFIQAVKSASNVKDVKIVYLTNDELSQLFDLTSSTIFSDNIITIMNYTLQESDNMYAEFFLRQLGSTLNDTSFSSITEKGIKVVKSILTDSTTFNVDANSFYQNDGSGLSRHNLVSPYSLVSALSAMYYKFSNKGGGQIYKSMLPQGGVSGTLKNRFLQYPGVVWVSNIPHENTNICRPRRVLWMECHP